VKLSKLKFTIVGATALMMSNPQAMLQKNGSGSRGPKKRAPHEEEAEIAAYRDAQGYLGFPALGVRNSVITAAGMHRVKTRSLKTFVSHIQIEPADLLVLTNAKGKKIKDYKIDIRRVVNKQMGAIMVARPIVEDWRATFELIFDPQLMPERPEDVFAMLLDDAGTRIGIGAYRPEKGGWFGRFTVE
jgi:hypothetical protein